MNRRLTLIVSFVLPLLLVGLFRVLLTGPAEAHPAAVFTVNSIADTGGPVDCGDGNCELREALAAAAISAGPDSIVFDLPDNSTITLQLGSLPAIAEALTIDGSDVVSLTISANNASGIFEIGASAPVTMTSLILRDGQADYGGAIHIENGSLTLLDSRLISNMANYDGGSVYKAAGELTVNGSSFAGNSAQDGAGIFNFTGVATVDNSTFSDNSAIGGGGIANQDVLTVRQSVFRNNDVLVGGGIVNSAALAVFSSTFEGNQASQEGGAIASGAGTVTVDGSSFTANSGRAVYSLNSRMVLSNSLFNDNNQGAVSNYGGNLMATDTIFSGNATANNGGAISSSGIFTATNITVSDNSSEAYGGGISINGGASISLSTFSGNSTALNGGAIYKEYGWATISSSTFADNSAFDEGGGVYNSHASGPMTVTNSTFSGNGAGSGGGIVNNDVMTIRGSTFFDNNSNGASALANYGPLTVVNSTFSGNSSTNSGAMVNSGDVMTLTNSTISDNTVGPFAGALVSFGATTTLANSILANSVSGPDCMVSGIPLVDGGGNLVEDGSCSFSVGGDPNLGALQDNGGPTWTRALLQGSPAIDAGNEALCPATDQRGAARPADGDGDGTAQCDIGAYEVNESYEGPEFSSLNIVSPVDEGSSTTLSGIVNSTDPGDTLTITIDWDDGTQPDSWATSPTTFERDHIYGDDGIYMVQVSVSDTHGLSDSEVLPVVANNVAPTVNAGPDQSAGVGETVTVAATLGDPGADSHTATINWGDGTTEPAIVSGNNVSANHVYTDEGSFTVAVTVTDDEMSAGRDSLVVTVTAEPGYSLHLPIIFRAGSAQ